MNGYLIILALKPLVVNFESDDLDLDDLIFKIFFSERDSTIAALEELCAVQDKRSAISVEKIAGPEQDVGLKLVLQQGGFEATLGDIDGIVLSVETPLASVKSGKLDTVEVTHVPSSQRTEIEVLVGSGMVEPTDTNIAPLTLMPGMRIVITPQGVSQVMAGEFYRDNFE